MDDPLVKEALSLIEHEVIQQWEVCPARDKEAREFLWMYYKTVRKFAGVFEGAIQTGTLAKHKLLEQQSATDKLRRFVQRS